LSIFATEFPVKNNVSEAMFMAEAIAWIRGIKKSFVLNDVDVKEFEEDDARIESASGEVLSFKKVNDSNLSVIGVRHELPDDHGRVWRTECVLTKNNSKAYFRVRGQCVARDPQANILRPRKPHLIRQAVEGGWATNDGPFEVLAKAHYLTEKDLSFAEDLILGREECLLPCIYISRNNDNSLPVDENKFALSLSGLAHVIIEPTRSFSFSLMEASKRMNPYGGAIGVIIPEMGEIRRFLGAKYNRPNSPFTNNIEEFIADLMSKRVAQNGWEWQTLQEHQARVLRKRLLERDADGVDEYIRLFDEELSAKDEIISNLRQTIALLEAKQYSPDDYSDGLLPDGLVQGLGRELYVGEFSDRLLLFLMDQSQAGGDVDKRSEEMIKRIMSKAQFSGRSVALTNQIKAAGRDGNQMPKQMGQILSGLGFVKTTDGKHTKYKPSKELFGLSIQILPNTPSDAGRGGKNRASEIIKDFSLHRLK
jgi:hypothetical protein